MTDDRNQWVAIELDFADHPKMLRVGAVGGWAHLRAIIYAARYRTDGFIPDEAVWKILHDDPVMEEEANGLEATMVQANLWHRVANGYQIHDYLRYQSNALTIREKRQQAGRKGGQASAKQRASKHQASKLDVDVDVDIEKDLKALPVENTDINYQAILKDIPR